MSNTNTLFEEISAHYTVFVDEHGKNMAGNKAAGSRARKAVGEMKKLVTGYRKASVADNNGSR